MCPEFWVHISLETHYEALSPSEKRRMKEKNWERVFDLSPLNTDWMRRGYDIQATFWELRLEQVRDVRFFRAAAKFDPPPSDTDIPK